MQNKKIFFVADAKSIHTSKWVDYFVDKGYDVHLATFATINNTKCKNIYYLSDKTINVKGGNYHYIFSVYKLANILKKVKPDSLNAHYSYSMGLISFLAIQKSQIDTEFSIVCDGSDVLAPPKPFLVDKLNRYLLKKADKIFAVSDQIKDKILKFGVEAEKVFVGQYGINIDSNTQSIKKDIDILSNRNYVANSNIEFLLDGLKDFKDKKLNIVFVLPHISKEKIEEFRTSYPFISFYEQVPYDEMVDFLLRTKIYISATKSDGTSLSLLEAMGSRAIPIVSNIVSNRSWVLDGVNGYLFDTKKQFIQSLNNSLQADLSTMVKVNKILINDKCIYKNQMNKIERFLLK